MQIEINGKRNITLDFNAPKKFRLVKDGAEIPYIRTGKNSFRLSKPVEGFVELEEIVEQPRYMQPVQLQPQQMTVINPQDVDRLNEAVRQMALVNPQDVMIINQTAEQLEKNQNFIAQTQKEITDNQTYIDQQQQRLNETALGIQALETDNSQRLDGAENAILNLAGEISNVQNMAVDGMNTALNKIEEQGISLQAEIDTKADKDELETLRKDFEEKSDQFSNAMSNYSGGTAYDTLPQGGEAGQILAKRTDRQGDYIWIDQTPVIVKSETIPTASEKYKGEVYQYVGETGDYTHGYIYECQEIDNNFVWVRLDVQPNTAVWGQITGTLSDQTDLQDALDDKQDKLNQTQMDAVNSGANQSNIAQITTNQSNINTINSKIPVQASSSNQLADKEFVNSSISTNTANFIGTFASISDLESYSGTVTNNDYAFVVNRVVTDNGNDWATFTALNAYDKTLLSNFDYAWVVNGANFDLYRFDIVNQVWELRATAIEKSSVTLNSAYNRYKAVVSGSTTWTYEYTLNNSSFTAGQWQAINSGITPELVAEFQAKGALLDYTNDILSLEDSEGNVLSSVTIRASAATDNKSITKNSSNELQTVGVINSRDSSTAVKTWIGTRQQYDGVLSKDADTLYNITDTGEIYLGSTLLSNYGADTSLSNLTSTGKNIANWSNNVTNCITEIPQDIKLELNNGTLTLKAGSKVYVPNGAGVFDEVTVSSDKTLTVSSNDTYFLATNSDGYVTYNRVATQTASGTSTPASSYWMYYNTNDNKIYDINNGVNDGILSFPLCKFTVSDGAISSIDQVFNGFGYIGSTWFLLPNVKFSVTYKRNEDGSYKTYIINNSSIKTLTRTSGALSNWTVCASIYNYEVYDIHYEYDCYIVNNLPTSGTTYTTYFNLQDGIPYYTSSGKTPISSYTVRVKLVENTSCDSSGKITTSGKFLLPFTRALSINDSSTISGWSMPSSRYIDLTLGASGSTYTAPANGWFLLVKTANANNQYIYAEIDNPGLIYRNTIYALNGLDCSLLLPVKKGARVLYTYTAGGNTKMFRFIYAEGEQ